MLQNCSRRYEAPYKQELVLRFVSGVESIPSMSTRLGMTTTTLYRWFQQYQADPLCFSKNLPMKKKAPIAPKPSPDSPVSNEVEMLRLKVLALETLIDVAESELQISIRKKSSAKQSLDSEQSDRT